MNTDPPDFSLLPPPVILVKVMAYITRQRGDRRQLLVFKHKHVPEAGVQVPAGTVKPGEALVNALIREVLEETGRNDFTLARKVGVFYFTHPETHNVHERHVYHLLAPNDTPDEWEWLETAGGELSDDEGYLFSFYWVDLEADIELAGNQAGLLLEL
jgi:8-oxo-dGTP pyrophosphatase MutT (NUDIX family)